MFRIEMLPANEGDCLWIEYGDANNPRRMVIDAGRKEGYRTLADRLAGLSKPVDLFVMTHIDDDHIFGAVPLFADERFNSAFCKDTWYNGYTHLDSTIARRPAKDQLGPLNGEIFAGLLLREKFPWNEAFDEGATIVVPETGKLPAVKLTDDMTLTLLSPTWKSLTALKHFWEKELDGLDPGDAEGALEIFANKPALQPDVLGALIDVEDLIERPYKADTKEPNGSSIAFLAEHDGQAVLFTGDAHPPILEQSIARLLQERGQTVLPLNAFKISHHGSKNNTSSELLKLLDCRRFLISTNGSRHGHPDQEAIARILYRNYENSEPTELYFNYQTPQNSVWDDDDLRQEWNYQTHYPPAGSLLNL
jgi:glyoxylase-like metal-dependent hydrolase (beta-lactamase superfamily II)